MVHSLGQPLLKLITVCFDSDKLTNIFKSGCNNHLLGWFIVPFKWGQ